MAEIIKLDSMASADFERVAAALEAGALVCLPSDTVYGLACLPEHAEAIGRLYKVKGRDWRKPLALVFTSIPQIYEVISDVPLVIRHALERLLPGPVTAIVPLARPLEGREIHSEASAGVRIIPPPAGDLYRRLPGPLAVTSANVSGRPDPVSVDEIPEPVAAACQFVIDAGRCHHCRPSTLVDLRPLTGGQPARILRQGALPANMVAEALAGLR